MKKLLIISLLLLLILAVFSDTIKAVAIDETLLETNINKLNYMLDTSIDATNPNYLTEILDENGNAPAYEYYPKDISSRSIKALKAYDGKIFMALGDFDTNTGPVKVIYYDTTDGKIKSSGTINDEAIQIFNIIDGKLYTTGCDPRDAWGYGSYYIYNKETNTWDKHMKNDGWIHVFNIVEFKDKLFMCGSTVARMQKSCIQVSTDNGETFESVPVYKNDVLLPYDDTLRCYNFVKINDKLYGYIYYSNNSNNGLYEYDEENNLFDKISSPPPHSHYSSADTNWYNNIYLEHEVFNNTLVCPSGTALHTSTDLKTYSTIRMTKGTIRDVTVCDNTLYALSYESYNSSSSEYIARIYSTKDLKKFDLVYEFTTKAMPFSLEYYDNNFYVGTGAALSSSNNQNGSFYRINLNGTKRSVNFNKATSTIEIIDNNEPTLIEYDLSSEKTVFETTLTFDNNMNEKEWIQEYSKIRNLGIAFAAVTNGENVDLNSSTSYFNTILSKNIITSSVTAKTGIEYAQNIFSKELNIKDNAFTLSSAKISESDNEYKTLVTLTVNNKIPNDNVNNNNSNTTDNNNTNTNTNNNTNSSTTTSPAIQEVLIIPPTKTKYNVGEKLNLDGLKITAIYVNNKIEEVTKGYTVTGYNRNKEGKQTVKISYKSFSTTYQVKVVNVSPGDSSSSNTNTNTSTNTNINNNENSEVNNLIDNNKLSQTAKNFEFKTLLQIIIVLSILTIVILIIRDNKYKKTKKE